MLAGSPRDLDILAQTVQLGVIFMNFFLTVRVLPGEQTTLGISNRGYSIHVIGYTDDRRIEKPYGWGDNEKPLNHQQQKTTTTHKATGMKGRTLLIEPWIRDHPVEHGIILNGLSKLGL